MTANLNTSIPTTTYQGLTCKGNNDGQKATINSLSNDLIAEALGYLEIGDIQNLLITSKALNITVIEAANLLIPISLQKCFARIFQADAMRKYVTSSPLPFTFLRGKNCASLQQINTATIQPYCNRVLDCIRLPRHSNRNSQNIIMNFLKDLRSVVKSVVKKGEFSGYGLLKLCSIISKKTNDPVIKQYLFCRMFEFLIEEGMFTEAGQLLTSKIRLSMYPEITEGLLKICKILVDKGDFAFAERLLQYISISHICQEDQNIIKDYYLDAKRSAFDAVIQDGANQDLTEAYNIANELLNSTYSYFSAYSQDVSTDYNSADALVDIQGRLPIFNYTIPYYCPSTYNTIANGTEVLGGYPLIELGSNCMRKLCEIYISKGDMENAEKTANSCLYLCDQQKAYQALAKAYVEENNLDKYLNVNKQIITKNKELFFRMIGKASSFFDLDKLIKSHDKLPEEEVCGVLEKITSLLRISTDNSDVKNIKSILNHRTISQGTYVELHQQNNSNSIITKLNREKALETIIPVLCDLQKFELAVEIIAEYETFAYDFLYGNSRITWDESTKNRYLIKIVEAAKSTSNFQAAKKAAKSITDYEKEKHLKRINKLDQNNCNCVIS